MVQTYMEEVVVMMELYGNTILRIALSYVKIRQDAEDILQDVLVKYMTTQPKFSNKNHEKAWFLRVAINMAKNKCNSAAYRLRGNGVDTDYISEAYQHNDVLEAVYQLPVKYKEIIYLYYYEDYSTKEIAEFLHKKETTVKSLLRRGRIKLSGTLKED